MNEHVETGGRVTKEASRNSAPLYDLIYRVLRDHLEDGSFPPGLVLGESAVARAFRASRTPAVTALQRLRSEGLIQDFSGSGYLAGTDTDATPIRRELTDVGLRLPDEVATGMMVRNHHGRIYPDVEHAVAACLAYGRFLLNESALAEHYDVSRTVAHEVLVKLERTGLITQDTNQRWYAGPLSSDKLREHFEMRWLLEPTALGQAMDRLSQPFIAARRDRLQRARRHPPKAANRERLELDLHVDIVLDCASDELRQAIRRSQLPLIPTHSTFARLQYPEEIETMFEEHLAIFDLVLAGKKRQAIAALEAHIRRSLNPNLARLKRLGKLPDDLRRSFLVPVAPGSK